jgi:hypothetical protein
MRLFALALISAFVAQVPALAAQDYRLPFDVAAGGIARDDAVADVPVDLTGFLAGLGASGNALDLASLQVVELDGQGDPVDLAVPFQFDPAAGFDPALEAAGTLVVMLAGPTAIGQPRHFELRFDTIGACDDCPPPPAVLAPVTVDSLQYENQLTYRIATPAATYLYHTDGAGLASIVDAEGEDWISFRDVPGSGAAGEYRGLPNLVFTYQDADASFFHPGFDNAASTLVHAGPLKVTVRSTTLAADDTWTVLWEFLPDAARMTVEQVGAANGGDYWLLYEGTPGGALDDADQVVRADGTVTSATATSGRWEETLPGPTWVGFLDPAAARYLYLADLAGDDAPDSYRPMGNSGQPPQMTVFGLGRVLNSSPSPLVPRMSGTGRSFVVGLADGATVSADLVAARTRPLDVTVGEPTGGATAAPAVIAAVVLEPAHPNPFNPSTRIAYRLAERGAVRLTIHDARGRLVQTIVDGTRPAGRHVSTWDGRTSAGRPAPAGVYLARLQAAGRVEMRKLALVE